MQNRRAAVLATFGVISIAFVAQAQVSNTTQASHGAEESYRPPRTSWGDPDLEGTWPGTNMAAVPLQRPESFGTRNVLTDAEFAERRAQAARQAAQDLADFDFDNPSVPFGQVGGGQSPPQHWFERGETQRQISLIVDPPNGRLPALTAAAQKREADRRRDSPAQPASYTDFSLYERCITRGLAGSILPGGYNNGNQIFQSPGYVTIVNEMIHESRIVPLDGRPPLSPALGSHLGDSRGRWDGDTLVVETKNFIDDEHHWVDQGVPASGELTIVERIRLINGGKQLEIAMTLTDPKNWEGEWKGVRRWNRVTDIDVQEVECRPDLNEHLQSTSSKVHVR